jgi:uncharacterized CHY-type Zn-finger protein
MAEDVCAGPASANLCDVVQPGMHNDSDLKDDDVSRMETDYEIFRDVYYSEGFTKKNFAHLADDVDLENTAHLTESSIKAYCHNVDVIEQHILDAFVAFRLETEGVITEEDSSKLMKKSYRKVGACANCPRIGNMRCKKCMKTYYCSKECQKTHWATHKKACQTCEASSSLVL